MKRQRGLVCLALALFVALGFTPAARAASPEIIWLPEGYTLKGDSYYIPELNWLRMGNYDGDPCVVDLSTGRIVERFKDIKPFTEGLAAVCQVNAEYGWDEWGYIDETGQIVIPMEYDEADPFSDGLAAVFNRMGWSLGGWDTPTTNSGIWVKPLGSPWIGPPSGAFISRHSKQRLEGEKGFARRGKGGYRVSVH